MGDDALAERYTDDLQSRHSAMFPFVRCTTLALRGRLASRRGDRGEALKCWTLSANGAIAEMVPLLALCVGLDCGGEEGEKMQCAASEAAGRPPHRILDELLYARSDQKIKFAGGDCLRSVKQHEVEHIGQPLPRKPK